MNMFLSHAPKPNHLGVGNAVPFFQAKFAVNQPGDAHEQEADAVADRVMRMKEGEMPVLQRMPLSPISSVMRTCSSCGENEDVQREQTGNGDVGGKSAPAIVSQVLSTGQGRPMDGTTRQFMESRFGQDFSSVRIHTDNRAAQSAAAIQARAYTSGKEVVFGAGEYRPESEPGKKLLAHELVHVGQQDDKKSPLVQRNPAAGAAALAVAGGLLADDATVIGVVDDIAIPFLLAYAWYQYSRAQPKAQPRTRTCPPCPPNPPKEIDIVPPATPHYPCPGSHWHYRMYNQNPQTCLCFLSGRLFGGCCPNPSVPC